MLLASYTWGGDAVRWASMGEEDAVEQALEDVAKIHPEIVNEFELGKMHAWDADPYAGGAFALFEPEQETRTPGGHHRAGGPHPLRRRALLPVPRVDPGRARVGHPRGERHPPGPDGHGTGEGLTVGDMGEIDEHDLEVEHRREHELMAEGAAQPVVTEPVPEETMGVAQHGLERRPGARKQVVVLGAGMAGLVAAYELKRQGHDVVVLEAQNRVGGRVLTCREFAPGLYAEFGAMRIPRSHDLTLEVLRAVRPADAAVRHGQPEGAGPRRRRAHDHGGGAALTRIGCRSTSREHERGKTADELWAHAIADIKALLDRDGDVGVGGDPRAVRSVLAVRVPRAPRVQRGGDRVLRGHELRRGRHEQRRHGGPPRGPRGRVRRHADDRRRDGPACRTRSSASCSRRSGSAPRSRAIELTRRTA